MARKTEQIKLRRKNRWGATGVEKGHGRVLAGSLEGFEGVSGDDDDDDHQLIKEKVDLQLLTQRNAPIPM